MTLPCGGTLTEEQRLAGRAAACSKGCVHWPGEWAATEPRAKQSLFAPPPDPLRPRSSDVFGLGWRDNLRVAGTCLFAVWILVGNYRPDTFEGPLGTIGFCGWGFGTLDVLGRVWSVWELLVIAYLLDLGLTAARRQLVRARS